MNKRTYCTEGKTVKLMMQNADETNCKRIAIQQDYSYKQGGWQR